ncbi:hypothetical protein [Paeniglutamicibacter sp. Y32M11]|uniref:hypothetical protein n=1 Tax=Paeniglutamicibacter sp. Y32M11 TaxID=2853258 RepID=UPI001C5334F8|nr:hypothetical protein [Paeniglutamicibacter sp. Y32M11]QXQ11543.1 hypothetical protein KUF55_06565 [Paeniglutamicibacter sp. Y32M11]
MSNRTPSRVRSRVIEHPATQGANALSHAPRPIPASRPEESTAKRRTTLSVVPEIGSSRRIPFLVTILGLVIASVVAVLLINVAIANGQYTAVDLRGQERSLSQENEALRQKALYLEAPQVVAAKAEKLGMVKPGAPAAINIESGKVSGTPTAAKKPDADAKASNVSLDSPVKPEPPVEKVVSAPIVQPAPAPVAAEVPASEPEAVEQPATTQEATKSIVSEPSEQAGTDKRPDFSAAELNGGTIPAPSLKTPGQ